MNEHARNRTLLDRRRDRRLHRERLAIVVAAGIGFLAAFLPWVRVAPMGWVMGIRGDGCVIPALFAPALVVALRGARAHRLGTGARLLAAIPAGLAAILGICKIADRDLRIADAYQAGLPFQVEGFFVPEVGTGIGLYVLVAASVAVVALVALAGAERIRSAARCPAST